MKSVLRVVVALTLFVTGLIPALPAGEAPQPPPQLVPVVSPAAKPFLGVTIDDNAASFDPAQGLPVTVVHPGSTANMLGIQVGDHLTAFNGLPVKSQQELARLIAQVKVGDTITVDLTRKTGDKTDKKTVTGQISERPQVKTMTSELSKLREDVMKMRIAADDKKKKEVSLVEVLEQLKEIEKNLPDAVKEFKKQYPNGEFNISIKVDIVSDKNAKRPIEVGNQPNADIKAGDGKTDDVSDPANAKKSVDDKKPGDINKKSDTKPKP